MPYKNSEVKKAYHKAYMQRRRRVAVKPSEDTTSTPEKNSQPPKAAFSGRVRLYHRDFPDGKIYNSEGEYLRALESGWVDAPWKIEEAP